MLVCSETDGVHSAGTKAKLSIYLSMLVSIIFITRAIISFSSGIFALHVYYSCITFETEFTLFFTVYNTSNYSISFPFSSGFARDIHMRLSLYRFNADLNTVQAPLSSTAQFNPIDMLYLNCDYFRTIYILSYLFSRCILGNK